MKIRGGLHLRVREKLLPRTKEADLGLRAKFKQFLSKEV